MHTYVHKTVDISSVTDRSIFDKIKQTNFWQDSFMKTITIGIVKTINRLNTFTQRGIVWTNSG